MTSRDADRRVEIPESHPEGSQRNWREEGLGASRVTARREDSGPEAEQLVEAVVERREPEVGAQAGGAKQRRSGSG